MHDVVIRHGRIADGTGTPAFVGDVAVDGDRITEVGRVPDGGRQEIDATGLLVTPGFVDVHTHLDAQVWWDPRATPSTWHGVTSAVMGNCGFGFAPCRPGDEEYLAKLMESVEDIPADTVMNGLPWNWETYGEFLTRLGERPLGLNMAGLLGHCAVRWYVMGAASMGSSAASPAEQAAMESIVEQAMAEGAIGFSTSRTPLHRVPGGGKVPGTYAPWEELQAFGRVLARHGRGVFGAVTQLLDEDGSTVEQSLQEVRDLADLALSSGRTVTFALAQSRWLPEFYEQVLEVTHQMRDRGADLRPQTTVRGIGIIYTLASRTPFDKHAAWKALRRLPLDERLALVGSREGRAALLEQADGAPYPIDLDEVIVFDADDARYDGDPERSLGAIARRRGVSGAEAFLDLCLESEGRQAFSWSRFNSDPAAVQTMLEDPSTLIGLADAGAHVGMIMDASQPTWVLAHWARDRGVMSVEDAVRRLTSDPARTFGLDGRGTLRPGSFADVNVIDLPAMRLHQPQFVHDMPGGAGRLVQRAEGYRWTFVNGRATVADGAVTDALPGVVVGATPA